MKKITLLLFFAMLTFTATYSQVLVDVDFDSGIPAGWNNTYGNTTIQSCDGSSPRDNIWSNSASGNLTTTNFASASNGTDLDVSFDYKVVEYSFSNPVTAQGAGWGTAQLQYSTDDGSSWTTVYTIDDNNHVVSNTCATVSVTIPAADIPSGSDVKLQILNTWASGDYYFYIDNFSANQFVSCPKPEDINQTPVNTTETNISWTPGDSETQWTYEYGVSPYTQGSGGTSGTVSGSPMLNLTGLLEAETYDIYIQANCGTANGDSTYESLQWTQPAAGNTFATAIPITPSPAGTGCTSGSETFAYDFSTGAFTDSGMDGTCNDTDTGLDIFFTWTATTDGLKFRTGGGGPGIVIRDAAGTEIICEATLSTTDINLYGWDIGDDLIIQVYDWGTAAVSNFSFCLEEFTLPLAPDCASNPTPADMATDIPVGTITLNWDAPTTGPAPTSYDLYSGSMSDGSDFNLVTGDISGTTVNVTVTDFDEVVYWRIVPKNDFVEAENCPIWVFTMEPIPAAPANDECSGAIALTVNPDLTCGTVTSATNVSATASPQPDNATGTPSRDVWFTFVATHDTHVVSLINKQAIIGSSTDMVMVIFDDAAGCNMTATNEIDESDPDSVEVDGLTVGNTYYVRVYGWSIAQANFDICVGSYPPGTTCDDPSIVSSLPFNTSDDTENYGDDYSGSPGADCTTTSNYLNGDDVVYAYTADFDGPLDIALTNLDATYAGVFVYTDCADIGNACVDGVGNGNSSDDMNLSIDVTNGTTYYIVITTWPSPQSVGYTLDITKPVANDDCDGAEMLTLGTTYNGDNTGATDSGVSGCLSGTISDVWYSFVAPTSGEATITVTGSGYQYELFSGADCANLTSVSCNTSENSSLTAGDTYYIRVNDDGSTFAPGAFTILVEDTPLSVNNVDQKAAFSYYPNPVNNSLTLNAKSNVIENVTVYNMLGQQVLAAQPNTLTSQLNMSNLQDGAYFVKVTIANTTQTVKVIKQ